MTYEQFEQKNHKIDAINKLLDRFNDLYYRVSDEEKQQILIYMEYLELEYKKLENEFIILKEYTTKAR